MYPIHIIHFPNTLFNENLIMSVSNSVPSEKGQCFTNIIKRLLSWSFIYTFMHLLDIFVLASNMLFPRVSNEYWLINHEVILSKAPFCVLSRFQNHVFKKHSLTHLLVI